MNRSCYTIFFLFLLSTLTTGANLNWFEAQEQCRDRGGLTIKKDKSNQSYWIGRYRRITPWIKIKGCFNDSVLSNITRKVSLSMFRKSVGICQEMCQRHNTTVFAVKGENCICIQDVSAMFLSESVDPQNCNSTCFPVQNDIYENECGGNSSYNVFEFESNTVIEGFGNRNQCLALQCTDRKFISNSCSVALFKYCKGNSSYGPATEWTKAMKNCEDADQPSYLFGNVELQNANLACSSIDIPNNIALFWIGVARQKYLNKDDGWNFSIDQRESFIECGTSTKKDYRNCLAKINNSVFCSFESSDVPSVSSSSLDTRHTTEHETLIIGKEDITTQNTGARDDVSDFVTVLPIIVVTGILLILAVTVVLIIYFRRKNLNQNKEDKKNAVDSPSVELRPENEEVSSHLYLKLEENSPKLSHENKVTSKRLFNDTPEYMYDHLRDKHLSNGVEDDTYHHAAARLSEDASDYDTMGKSSVNNASDQDATYDHAHTLNNCHSDYGYNVPKQNCFNDNPYDIAGER
ncbi:uncharacterized protein LOC111110221 isoform X2 [Crassostrea virginica]